LADQDLDSLSADERGRLSGAWGEYEAAQRLNADRAEGRANLGSFLVRRGERAAAEAEFLAGIRLDPLFVPLYVNLADLYRAEGREAEAVALLRRAIAVAPEAAAPRLALGLGLIREKRYAEALPELARAAALAPDQARYAYVYAVALQSSGDAEAARREVGGALARHKFDRDLLGWAVQDALGTGDTARALVLAKTLSTVTPDDPAIGGLIEQLRAR
jgi:tetratricopeptide (TPR) repeat protein